LSPSLIFQTSFLGDTVLTTPLVELLAERGPVDVVTTPAAATLLENHPRVRAVIPYDKRGRDSGAGGAWRLARRLRASAYESAYMAQGSLRSALIVRAARVPRIVGFDSSGGRLLYTETVPFDRAKHHAVRLASLAGVGHGDAPAVPAPALFPGPADVEAARAAIGGLREDGRPTIALAPGSVWATKRWPHFPELARTLTRHAHLVVIGSRADGPLAGEIVAAAPESVDATGRLGLLASAALISECDALVTNDSAPLHLASAMKTPTIALFGPTVPALGFGPLAPGSEVLGHPSLSCRPCHAHGPNACPLGHFRCMLELTPERVAQRVIALVQ